VKKHIVVILLLLKLLVFSQDLSYVHYSTHNGLPSNQVYNLYQDNNGFMWFATDRGIAKYDGNKFTQYDQSDGLTSSTIFRFFPQENGDVWCSTFQNKWFYFNPDNNIFIPYEFNDTIVKYSKGSLNENFYISDNGTLYIGYQNYPGFLAISNKGELLHSLDEILTTDVYDCHYIIEYNDSSFFNYYTYKPLDHISDRFKIKNKFQFIRHIFKDDQINFYHKEFKLRDFFIFTNADRLSIKHNDSVTVSVKYENRIIGLGKYDEDHIWVGFVKGGVKVISLNGRVVKHFLKDKSVTYATHDSHGGLWISTLSNGVYHSRNCSVNKYELNDDDIYFVSNGKGTKIIAGTISGFNYEIGDSYLELLSSADNKAPDYTVYSENHSSYISTTSSNVLSRYSYLSNFFSKNILNVGNRSFLSICKDFNKPFLANGSNTVVYWEKSLNESVRIYLTNRIRSVCWNKNGIYIGTLNGLMDFDTVAKEINPFEMPLLKSRIEKVTTFNDFTYLGTMGEGLLIMSDDTLIQISKNEGLSSNLVNELFVENDSIIWVATNNGLNRVLIRENKFHIDVFNEDDGLVDSYINDVYVKEDEIWIGTRSGLCSMSNGSFVSDSTFNLYFQWNSVKNKSNVLSDSILNDLDCDQNNLIFSYDAVCFSVNDGVSFRFKILGDDNDWSYTSAREIKYFSLNPGRYSVKVQASVNGSDWKANELIKSFIIYPPFYQTNWFYSFIILLICALVYFFFKIRVFTYNKDIVRDLLRLLLKRVTPKSSFFTVKIQGLEVKINSDDVLYVKAEGNYLDVITKNKKYVIRCKIGEFLNLVPDKIEYLKINRSNIVRKDKIQAKSSKTIQIGNEEFNVSRAYQKEVNDLPL
jgi:hypothetical protein